MNNKHSRSTNLENTPNETRFHLSQEWQHYNNKTHNTWSKQ